MNTKIFLVTIAIVAAVATFTITTMANLDLFSGIGSTEAFAQNMTGNVTNMTAGNVTNMTG